MQRDQFSQMLQAPHPVSPEQRDELIELTRNYPWFSAAHVLLAKLDHDHRHIQYHTHLKRAAVYAPDREVLYKLLMKPQLLATVEAFDAACEDVEEPVSLPEPSVRDDQPLLAPAPEPTSNVDTELALDTERHLELQSDAPEEDTPELVHIEEPQPEVHNSPEVPEVPEVTGDFETGGEAPVIEEETTALQIKRAGDFDDLQREILLEAITSSIEREVGEVDHVPEPLAAPLQTPSTDPNSEQLSAYTRWLLQKSVKAAGPSNAPIPSSTAEPVDLKEKQRNLIDTFIQNDPKISKGKVEMFSTENLARMSLVEDERFVTETMAAIYARQGHIRKAIKAYQLLALNYPEKSVYFANQIKKLQERR